MSPRPPGRLRSRIDCWSRPATAAFSLASATSSASQTRRGDLIRVAEQCASGCAANGNIPGLVYRSQDFSGAHTGSYLWKGSIAYVTGTHSLKVGYQHTLMTDDRQWFTNNQNLAYRFNNGEPNQLTQSISPWVNNARAGWDALFVQEQWTRGRLTLQGAARFDRATELVSSATAGAVAIPADADRHSPKPVASTATRTSHPGWAWRTTCSGRA